MANGYSRSPVLIKGALIRFDAPLLIPIPNIIIFQYNPESLTRTLTPYTPPRVRDDEDDDATTQTGTRSQRSQPFDPTESFSLNLIFDAADYLEYPTSHPIAVATGVADRIAALEMLLYPVTEGISLLGSVGASVNVSAGGASFGAGGASGSTVPDRRVPVTLFIWGPGRILPVRLTSFSVEEQSFSPLLYPIRAKVNVGMRVLQPHVFRDDLPEEVIAKAAYTWTMTQKQLLATTNIFSTAIDALSKI